MVTSVLSPDVALTVAPGTGTPLARTTPVWAYTDARVPIEIQSNGIKDLGNVITYPKRPLVRRPTSTIVRFKGTEGKVPLLWLRFPPPQVGQRLLHGPGLVQRVPLEQLAVLHNVTNCIGVVNIQQWIFVEHDQIGHFAGLNAAQILPIANGFSAVNCRGAQNFKITQAAALERPHLPMALDSLNLAVAAN